MPPFFFATPEHDLAPKNAKDKPYLVQACEQER